MSSKFKIVSTSQKGRACFATENIKENEVILTETPLISCQFTWNKEYGYLSCDFCMKPLETAQENVRRLAFDKSIILPYPELDKFDGKAANLFACENCGTSYCSHECMSHAEKQYHNVVCQNIQPGGKFHNVIEIWKKMHYPPESATIMLVVRIFAMIKHNPHAGIVEKLNEFSNRSVNEDLSLCHKMLGEKFQDQLMELYRAIASTFGDDDGVLGKYLTFDGFISILAIIGTNSQGVGTSSLADWVKNVSESQMSNDEQQKVDDFIDSIYTKFNDTVGEFLNNEGSGLYEQQSKINHSCLPNAEIKFPQSNHMLQVVATRDIKPDEEICISYLDECQLERSRHSRQKYLLENYLFLCECEKCLKQIDDPDVTSDDDNENSEMDTDDD